MRGHERPARFARSGSAQRDHCSFRRKALHPLIGKEVRGASESAGISQIGAFAKIEAAGRDAMVPVDGLPTNRLPRRTGGAALSPMPSRRGRIELDTTIAKLGENRYYLLCCAFFERRMLNHLEHNVAGKDIEITSRSEDWAALANNGPNSREILASCTDSLLDNARFPSLATRQILAAETRLWAMLETKAGSCTCIAMPL